ncbi:hypothetical protein ID866_11448 [Astraeus odoratus]|nr:hypothetical protein ID866_11448 [Astraeus odoratus]
MSDWTNVPDAQLNWDDNDMDETTATKFQEKCQCKKALEVEEHKCQEEEEHHKAEAEQRHKAEEEARAHAATEEKNKCEEAVAQEQAATEAQKKQQWVKSEAGPGRSWLHNLKCLRCAKNDLSCEVVTGMKKKSACVGCTKLKEKCKWPAVEIVGGGSKQVTSPWGSKKKKRVRKSTMVDKVVVEGQETGQPEAGGSTMVAEAICELTRELTSQLDMLTDHILEELQGQLDALESLVKTQQNIGQKMTQHYSILEDMLGELEVFAANPGEPPEEEDVVEEEELEEARCELEGLGPIVNMEQEMEEEQQGENQDKGKGKERAE